MTTYQINEKCEICGEKYYSMINGKEVCRKHFFHIYFSTRDEGVYQS